VTDRIYVVVPVFNRKSLTQRFLCCMREQQFANFQIIVVDDGSSDGTGDLIADEFPEVHLLRGNGNLWWTGATNLGIRHAMASASADDAILVVNDDLEVNSDYLDKLYHVWKSMPRTLIGSVVVDIRKPDLIVDGGAIINWWTAKATKLNSQRRLADFAAGHHLEVSSLTGWGTLIPIQVFRDIGLYNDRHFQQCGDTELPVRAMNTGYRLIVSYDAVVKAHVDASDGINVASRYSLREIRKYFFDIKSNFRLRYRFFFSIDTATNPLALVSFLLFDLARITGHFFVRLRFR
jgi:GT2 family glycosyltransferase